MRRITKLKLAALAGTTLIGLGAANAAHAADAPILDTPNTTGCTPGTTTHTDHKWTPDVSNAGPTMWTINDAPANTKSTFVWKGVPVAYHRDGSKTQQAFDQMCALPTLGVDPATCSVTVPLTPGVETRLYGVNGHDESPITGSVTVTGGLEGIDDTAPQFWIGYTAKPGHVVSGTGTTHIDFYNGDHVRDCDV